MAATYILAMLAVAFLAAGLPRFFRAGGRHGQAATWVLIGAIFGAVSAWLWSQS